MIAGGIQAETIVRYDFDQSNGVPSQVHSAFTASEFDLRSGAISYDTSFPDSTTNATVIGTPRFGSARTWYFSASSQGYRITVTNITIRSRNTGGQYGPQKMTAKYSDDGGETYQSLGDKNIPEGGFGIQTYETDFLLIDDLHIELTGRGGVGGAERYWWIDYVVLEGIVEPVTEMSPIKLLTYDFQNSNVTAQVYMNVVTPAEFGISEGDYTFPSTNIIDAVLWPNAAGKHWTFDVDVHENYSLDLQKVVIRTRRGTYGPYNQRLRYSVDGGSTYNKIESVLTGSGIWETKTFNNLQPSNLTGRISFILEGWGYNSTDPSNYWRFDYVDLYGAVHMIPSIADMSVVSSGAVSDVNLNALSMSGSVYQVEWTSDLVSPSWTPLGSPVTATEQTHSYQHQIPSTSNAFLRVRWIR